MENMRSTAAEEAAFVFGCFCNKSKFSFNLKLERLKFKQVVIKILIMMQFDYLFTFLIHTDLFFCSMLHAQNLFYIHILYTQKGVYSNFE